MYKIVFSSLLSIVKFIMIRNDRFDYPEKGKISINGRMGSYQFKIFLVCEIRRVRYDIPIWFLKYSYASRRRVMYAKNGMICASQPLAAQAGLAILRRRQRGGLLTGRRRGFYKNCSRDWRSSRCSTWPSIRKYPASSMRWSSWFREERDTWRVLAQIVWDLGRRIYSFWDRLFMLRSQNEILCWIVW